MIELPNMQDQGAKLKEESVSDVSGLALDTLFSCSSAREKSKMEWKPNSKLSDDEAATLISLGWQAASWSL